ncbi:unnamed protein product [Hymenolepis diminuta]|uniref:Uncharacterized protein n=1 Tax=Hymenolepis diminuta TaxID=6216 RepID=A0A564YJQ0_HYMDI|nr:unnamed protein product [Hymenolepis diminuta]
MKLSKNPGKNPYKHVIKTIKKEGMKRKHHPELIHIMTVDLKLVSKVNAVEKIENRYLLSKPKANTVFYSSIF